MPASPATDRRPRAGRRAFTIVELMVGISVLGLLVALLAGVFSQVSSAWKSGEGSIERRRSARALADFIGQELQGAALPIEGASVAATGNLQFIVNPPTSQVSMEYRHADAIFWQAPLATEASYGDLAEIGYFVKWIKPDAEAQKSGRTAPRPALCRFFANPSEPKKVLPGNPGGTDSAPAVTRNEEFLIYHKTNPKEWINGGQLDALAPGDNVSDHAYRGLFTENVVGFWAQCYGLDGKDLFATNRTFDSRTGYLCKFQTVDDKGIKQPEWTEQRFLPAKVRISFAQIDSQTAPKLDLVWDEVRKLSQTPKVTNADQFIEKLREVADSNPRIAALLPGLRVYSTDVHLRNAR